MRIWKKVTLRHSCSWKNVESVFVCVLGSVQHSDHSFCLYRSDVSDTCLCLEQVWSLLGTSSRGHCSVCLPASPPEVFPLLFKRRSAVRQSRVPLTLREMKKDSRNRGVKHQKIEERNTRGLKTRAQKPWETRGGNLLWIHMCIYHQKLSLLASKQL